MISDAAVEAAAKAVYGGDHLDGSPHRDAWLRDFRIALEAAAPYMLADAWEACAIEAEHSGIVNDIEGRILTNRNPFRSQSRVTSPPLN